ncbi:MAG: hypothetical protein C5B51_11795 [Terriglobia bacterium]|nr:MAG: hypothetical protein C5B51_11795 [Terriglobia bacterium]
MPDDKRFGVYLSHSWRPRDVDLNLKVWDQLSANCELLVDKPEQPGADPPYYINRIEELLWRSDLFVSVLTYREPRQGEFPPPDTTLRCSPYSLFEIRLAERADLPRLIVYERSTGFRPPISPRPWQAYVPFDRGMGEQLPEHRQWGNTVHAKIEQWTQWAQGHRMPMSYEQSNCAVVLTGSASASRAFEALEDSLRQGNYEPVRCDPERQRSSDAFRMLREAGLVVAEFAQTGAIQEQLYAAAHGLSLPSIRLFHSESGQTDLPWILRGDPGGYQNDIVVWNKPEDLPGQVDPRIGAMFRLSPALRNGSASDYLQSKRYSQFFVFLSHTLKGPERALVEQIYALLQERRVTPFEYHSVNTSGIDWQKALNEALEKTTHFVVLLDPEYVNSQTCMYELEKILSRGEQVKILPFMINGRDRPHPKLVHIHHRLLEGDSPHANAEVVVQQIMAALDAALGHAASV